MGFPLAVLIGVDFFTGADDALAIPVLLLPLEALLTGRAWAEELPILGFALEGTVALPGSEARRVATGVFFLSGALETVFLVGLSLSCNALTNSAFSIIASVLIPSSRHLFFNSDTFISSYLGGRLGSFWGSFFWRARTNSIFSSMLDVSIFFSLHIARSWETFNAS